MPALTEDERKLGRMNLLETPVERLRFRLDHLPSYLSTTEAKRDLRDLIEEHAEMEFRLEGLEK